MKTKHLISISDLEKTDILEIFEAARDLKSKQKNGKKYTPLTGKTLAMIFSKPSTRTRVSFETGIYQLGGLGLFLSGQELPLIFHFCAYLKMEQRQIRRIIFFDSLMLVVIIILHIYF